MGCTDGYFRAISHLMCTRGNNISSRFIGVIALALLARTQWLLVPQHCKVEANAGCTEHTAAYPAVYS